MLSQNVNISGPQTTTTYCGMLTRGPDSFIDCHVYSMNSICYQTIIKPFQCFDVIKKELLHSIRAPLHAVKPVATLATPWAAFSPQPKPNLWSLIIFIP